MTDDVSKHKRLNIVLVTLLVTTLVLIIFTSYRFKSGLSFSLAFLDVGQGDAILLNSSEYSLLIDGGPSTSINYFLGKLFYPLCSIDSILLTHPHSDHLDGLNLVLDRCRVNYVFSSGLKFEKDRYKNFLNKISENENTKLINLYKDYLLKIDDLNILVVWPPEEKVASSDLNLNSLSLALFVDYKDFEALLLGDMEKDAQDQIDISGFSPYIQGGLDVMKFPHHGAKNALNEQFIDKIDPEFVVISVGKNSYGHPSAEVIEFLDKKDIKVYRTDKHGTIRFKYVK